MKQVVDFEISRLKRIINKFPELKRIASIFNQRKISWALAAGSAYFFYTGDRECLDDLDIWISQKDRKRVASILNKEWETRSSEKHQAENIKHGNLDFFTNCKKMESGKMILDYCWTDTVTFHLRKIFVDKIEYSIVSPEDVALLKIANPRGKKEMRQAKTMLINSDSEYFNQRKKECEFEKFSVKIL